MKTIIIDDEKLARDNVKTCLKSIGEIEVVAECANGFDGFKAINEHQPDLIFLDIQMPKINGFEMLELLENQPIVIFTTAFDEYAFKAFEAGAVDYLLKPFSQKRFDEAMEKCLKNSSKQEKNVETFTSDMPERQNRIVVKDRGEIRIVPVDSIKFIEADEDYVLIHTDDKKHIKKTTMNFLEQTLNPTQFVRIHRSYIINLKELTKIEPYGKNDHLATLKNGTKIPISRSGYILLKEQLDL